ncbi:hypothetical protein AYI68_g5549 [Smittium mucronatum]|uniref:Uncharacterized protein n=1 Tax=Smittium mucronatum TaxID=133383 RepID=A0A1R0GTY4_9FUNG|nr:hypothetical protein AYI68_g5549 [Smittium mucronatum]
MLLCRPTGCVPTGKGFSLPTEIPPVALLQVDWITEVTCSHELSFFSIKNSPLKLMSSYSEPTSNRINKIRLLPKRGIDQHGFPTNSC